MTLKVWLQQNGEVLVTAFTGLVTTLFAWTKGKRRSTAETDTIAIGNFELGFEAYQKLLNDLEKRSETKIQKLDAEVVELANELKRCKQEMQDILNQTVKDLRS